MWLRWRRRAADMETATAARETQASQELAKSRARLQETRKHIVAPLRERELDNHFADLIRDCIEGLVYRKPGARVHGTQRPGEERR